MNVVGIDLSLTGTGLAFINNDITVRTISSKGRATATITERYERVSAHANRIVANILDGLPNGPRLAVLEQPAQSKGALPGQLDSHGLWWLVMYWLRNEMPVAHVSPSTRPVYATGKGNAGKDAVLAAVVRRYPNVPVANNNEADALILAAMGARWAGTPIDNPLPQTHLRAMTAPQWPDKDPT